MSAESDPCRRREETLLADRQLIIAANRGPVSISRHESGELTFQRAAGGLVTALLGLVTHIQAVWIASPANEIERQWERGRVPLGGPEETIEVEFVDASDAEYEGHYNTISNPLLWFLQHSMWNFISEPTINTQVWDAWENGYVAINRHFADAISRRILASPLKSLVMLQDYHLYLAPSLIRKQVRHRKPFTLAHFIHIPWPGAEDWGFLPPAMRTSILEGLCAVDLLGLQTRDDALNFIRTVESHLPEAQVNYRRGRIRYQNHTTYVRDFPISVDIQSLLEAAESQETAAHHRRVADMCQGRSLIVRTDRTEPSKNIVRGFQALEILFQRYPEHLETTLFLAILAPSRLRVEEYQKYLDEIMAAAGRINAQFGSSIWEPVRVLLGDDYARGLAAMQLYDVLLVNSIADGMNLVAKEGPLVNQRDGVLILSERTGARQQLHPAALVISPCDIVDTAEALHRALVMPTEERHQRAAMLQAMIRSSDINDWFCQQIEEITRLEL